MMIDPYTSADGFQRNRDGQFEYRRTKVFSAVELKEEEKLMRDHSLLLFKTMRKKKTKSIDLGRQITHNKFNGLCI